jgi:energy-coupling factor transport system ATP-binding protein
MSLKKMALICRWTHSRWKNVPMRFMRRLAEGVRGQRKVLKLTILETKNLTYVYGAGTPFERTAICGVDFTVTRGERIGIIGATGSGKSTFVQHLNGLLKPTSGNIFFDGKDIHESKDYTRQTRFKIGLVFQYPEYQLFENTVFNDIAFGPKNMGIKESEIRERVHEAAGFVRLDESLLEKSPFELSGGQKRRAAIAGVMAMMPEVLILDEPTAGLDPRGREEILYNIMGYKQAVDATLIIVTHNMDELVKSIEKVFMFDKGTIVKEGAPEKVFSDTAYLHEKGLAAPKMTMVAARLRALGLPISNDVLTITQLRAELNKLKAR